MWPSRWESNVTVTVTVKHLKSWCDGWKVSVRTPYGDCKVVWIQQHKIWVLTDVWQKWRCRFLFNLNLIMFRFRLRLCTSVILEDWVCNRQYDKVNTVLDTFTDSHEFLQCSCYKFQTALTASLGDSLPPPRPGSRSRSRSRSRDPDHYSLGGPVRDLVLLLAGKRLW